MGLIDNSQNDDGNGGTFDYEPRHRSVTPGQFAKIKDQLRDGERAHAIIRGSKMKTKDGGGTNKAAPGGGILRAIATESRVVIHVPQLVLPDDSFSVGYDRITSIDLGQNLMTRKVVIHTEGASYHVAVMGFDVDAPGEFVELVRELMDERSAADQAADQAGSQSPADRLRELESLYEEGYLNDEEYEQKRSEALDDL